MLPELEADVANFAHFRLSWHWESRLKGTEVINSRALSYFKGIEFQLQGNMWMKPEAGLRILGPMVKVNGGIHVAANGIILFIFTAE